MENKIKEYNEWLYKQDTSKLGTGLFSGKTGLCLYWYQQSRIYRKKDFEHLADTLIEEIIQNIDKSSSIDYGKGLVGIAMSLLYMEKQHYIEGNPFEMLKEITDKIYQELYFGIMSRQNLTNTDHISIIYALLYLCKYLHLKGISSNERNVIKGIIVKGINLLEESTRNSSIGDSLLFSPFDNYVPLFLRLLSRVYELDIFSYKLDMICKEWKDRIQTLFPLSDGNRFILQTELEHLSQYCRSSEAEIFNNHAKLLKEQTDLLHFINVEMRSRNIYIYSGLAGLLMYSVNACSPIDDRYYGHISTRVLQSPVWDDWKSHLNEEGVSFAFYNSLTGVVYSYQQFFSKQL